MGNHIRATEHVFDPRHRFEIAGVLYELTGDPDAPMLLASDGYLVRKVSGFGTAYDSVDVLLEACIDRVRWEKIQQGVIRAHGSQEGV